MQIEAVEQDLGKMPHVVKEMLRHFNGAVLFKATFFVVRLFGISTTPPLPAEQWPPEFWIDAFTPRWRRKLVERKLDWAIAFARDERKDRTWGILCDMDGFIHKWNVEANEWEQRYIPFAEWINEILTQGEALLA
jgi:hypothetical protein